MKKLKTILTAVAFFAAIGATFAINSSIWYTNPSSSGDGVCYAITDPTLIPEGCRFDNSGWHCQVNSGTYIGWYLFNDYGCVYPLRRY